MPAPPSCPEIDRWHALLARPLAPEEEERWEQHLSGCPVCQERLERAPEGDDLVSLARKVGDPTEKEPDPTLTEVLDRLHGNKAAPQPAAEEPDLYFLSPADRPDVLGTLGAYEVLEVVGHGGMGMVLKA